MKSGFICAVFLLRLVALSFALDPQKQITQYVHRVWTMKDGLPNNSVQCILRSRDGFLWVGTEEGLVRFDGVRFTLFDRSNVPEMQNNSIHSLLEDSRGNLWFSGETGLVRLSEGKFMHFGKEDGLTKDENSYLFLSGNGEVWAASPDFPATIDRFKNGRFHKVSFDSKWIYGIKNPDELSGKLLSGSKNGVVVENGKVIPFPNVPAFTGNGPIDPGVSGGIFLSCKSGPIPLTLRRLIIRDRDQNLWMGVSHLGLYRLTGEECVGLTNGEGMLNNSFSWLYEDDDRNLWVGTFQEGLNLFRDGIFTTFTAEEGLSNDFVTSVMEDRSGNLWVGTEKGLNLLYGRTFKRFGPDHGLLNEYIISTFEDTSGNVWIGFRGGGLMRYRNGRFENKSDPLISENVKSFVEDRRGDLWIGTGDSLLLLHDGKIRMMSDEKTFGAKANVSAILEDHRGDLWFGSHSGLIHRKQDKMERFTKNDGLPSNIVMGIAEDSSQNLWIGTHNGGLSLFRNGRFVNYSTRTGLCEDVVYSILEDNQGHLWLSGNKGICRVKREELLDFANGRIRSIHSASYGLGSGIKAVDCSGGFQPAGWKRQDGSLWFPTSKGVVMVNPAKVPENQSFPNVFIEQFTVDQSPLNSLAHIWKKGDYLQIPAGKKMLEIRYTAPEFSAPEKIRFRYKLEGVDQSWVEAGDRRTAYYTNVSRGDYRFHVAASSTDGYWNGQETFLSFTILPFFWQTLWFQLLTGAILFSLGFVLYKIRIKSLQTKTRMITQLQAAHDVQMSIMPHSDPEVPGFDVSGICVPAGEVGGDFFDYFWLDPEQTQFGIAVADVSGKSMKAAMVAILSSGIINSENGNTTSISQIFNKLNRIVFKKTDDLTFIALCIVSLNTMSGEVTFSTAGFNDPLLKTNSKTCYLGSSGQTPLGIIEDFEYEEMKLKMQNGEVLIFFTDGITETFNEERELFGYDRLMIFLSRIPSDQMNACEIKDAILQEVNRFACRHPQEDDRTVVVIKACSV